MLWLWMTEYLLRTIIYKITDLGKNDQDRGTILVVKEIVAK